MGRKKLSKVVQFRLPLPEYDKLNRFENKSIWLRRIVIKALEEEDI